MPELKRCGGCRHFTDPSLMWWVPQLGDWCCMPCWGEAQLLMGAVLKRAWARYQHDTQLYTKTTTQG